MQIHICLVECLGEKSVELLTAFISRRFVRVGIVIYQRRWCETYWALLAIEIGRLPELHDRIGWRIQIFRYVWTRLKKKAPSSEA